MNSSIKVMLLALLTAAGLAFTHAQISGQKSSGEAATAPSDFRIYSSPGLHLTYTYPADLSPVDGAFAAEATQRMLYGDDTQSGQAGPDRCIKVLLSVGSGSEGKGKWIRLGLAEVNGQCFPAKVLQKTKATQALLQNMVSQGTTVMGMMSPGQPAGYQIEGHWASFGAAQGEPVTKSDLQTDEQQVLGLAAVQAGSDLLTWVIETNDAAMFNRLLGTGVDFGTGKPEQLFVGRMQ